MRHVAGLKNVADIFPLPRNIRRTQREAGLVGEDKVSKLVSEMITLNEANHLLAARLLQSYRSGHSPNWSTAVLCALIVVAFFAGGLAGYLKRDNALLRDCISQIQVVQGEKACWVATKSLY